MRKLVLVLMIAAISIFAVSPLFAKGMMFGVKGGLNLANLTGSDVNNASIKTGIDVGAFLTYDISDIFAVEPELLFSMKGAKSDSASVTGSWKINYIEIPILLKAKLPTDGKIKPCIYVGPGIGFLLSSKISDDIEIDMKDFTKSTDITLIAGAGVSYMMEKGALSFEARYEVGLSTIAKTPIGTAPDYKTSDIAILVGYGFAF
ncbi:MAG TPA: porin family protein [Candidatus Krumholzibacteriaceae bacterium]